MMNCKEVAKLISSDRMLHESWIRRLQIRFHLLMCRHCSRLAQQISLLKSGSRQLRERIEAVDATELEHLESRVLNKLREGV